MRQPARIALVVFVCAECFSSVALGWGHAGHEIVATVATSRLTPSAQTGVRDLLGNATLADVST
ncbi:MAG: hypothetical protein ACREJC_04435, partial [Tepidisphaeraceae bacterium]